MRTDDYDLRMAEETRAQRAEDDRAYDPCIGCVAPWDAPKHKSGCPEDTASFIVREQRWRDLNAGKEAARSYIPWRATGQESQAFLLGVMLVQQRRRRR